MKGLILVLSLLTVPALAQSQPNTDLRVWVMNDSDYPVAFSGIGPQDNLCLYPIQPHTSIFLHDTDLKQICGNNIHNCTISLYSNKLCKSCPSSEPTCNARVEYDIEFKENIGLGPVYPLYNTHLSVKLAGYDPVNVILISPPATRR